MTRWEKDKIHLNNIGVATFDQVDTKIIDYLKNQIQNKKELKKATTRLYGHIKDEFYISPTSDYSDFICKSIFENNITMFHLNNINVLNKGCPLYIETSWINFQKKYEFNPLHDHAGVFSFIIFMQIPYKLEEEFKCFPDIHENKQSTSCLSFVFTSMNGDIKSLICNVDESYLYKMLIFPSKLKHMVYPFYTSDKERITVSGNVKFLVK